MTQTNSTISVALAGINGYGNTYLNYVLDRAHELGLHCTGIIDPTASSNPRISEIRKNAIPVFDTLEAFYENETAQLLIISAPIQYHLPMTRTGISHGSNVLCEKPLTATEAEAEEFRQIANNSSRFIAIGYQWSFTPPIQALKQDVMNGRLGAPKRLRTLCLWPRPHSYYARNNWAGRIKTDGAAWVLDSPANNATAHFLHNMLYIQGPENTKSAYPETVEAELYRANNVENYDSAAARIVTDQASEVFFYTTHAVERKRGPMSHFEFEEADVFFDIDSDPVFYARFADGTQYEYGRPNSHLIKLENAVSAIRDGRTIFCGVEAAMAQTACINRMQWENEIKDFPPDNIQHEQKENGDTQTFAEGLGDALENAYENFTFPNLL